MNRTKLFFRVWLASCAILGTAAAQTAPVSLVRLPGHVINALPAATKQQRTAAMANDPLTITVMLNWSDAPGFEAFKQQFEDPLSPGFRRGLTPDEFNSRFGPTQQAYDQILAFLRDKGFVLVQGSANRLTITVRGTRAQAEQAFQVNIDDYQLSGGSGRVFHANDADPAVPAPLAPLIRSIAGLANLAMPRSSLSPVTVAAEYDGSLTPATSFGNNGGLPPGIDGTGQTIGLIEFDSFNYSDISNWLNNEGLPAGLVNHVHVYPINGGTDPSGCTPFVSGCGTTEVLLDIDAVLGIAQGASIAVFIASNGTDYFSMINGAANQVLQLTGGKGGVLSMSWDLCEYEVSNSDADSMDTLLAALQLHGISFFNSSGDSGSTCTGGDGTLYPNRVGYPADAPHAVAVGGTSMLGSGGSYPGETWWQNSGGFGTSWHFALPNYQAPFTASGMRSVPDVSADASPGIAVCQGLVNGSPNCTLIGGTSLAAPIWAAAWALAAQASDIAHNGVGNFPSANGGYLYALSGTPSQPTTAFHPASTMTGTGNDFAHLGLGSPDITNLTARVAGPPKVSSISTADGTNSGPATGSTTVTVHGNAFVGVTAVLFGSVAAPSFTVKSETELVAVSPRQTTWGPMHIVVWTPAGESSTSSQDQFTYHAVVTGVNPSSGPMGGQQPVTVTGVGLDTQIFFGGVLAGNVQCIDTTKCTMYTPGHGGGSVDVTVGMPGWPNPADVYQYLSPVVTSISPTAGGEVENTVITLYGASFANGMTVTFEKLDVTGKVIWSTSKVAGCETSTSCQVWSPTGTGSVHIVVTVNNLTSPATGADIFTYLPFPEVTSVFPANGPAAGNTKVTITGINFLTGPGQTTFMFGHSQATTVSCATTTTCTVITPAWNSIVELEGNAVPILPTVSFDFRKGSTVLHESWTGDYGPSYPVQYFTYPGPCTAGPGGIICPNPLPPPIKPPCKGTTCQ